MGGRVHIWRITEQFTVISWRERHTATRLCPEPTRHAQRRHLARHDRTARLQQDLILRILTSAF